MSVNSAVPVPFGLSYSLKVTVPVGLSPPKTVAWSAIVDPTVADAGCWTVVIVGPEKENAYAAPWKELPPTVRNGEPAAIVSALSAMLDPNWSPAPPSEAVSSAV